MFIISGIDKTGKVVRQEIVQVSYLNGMAVDIPDTVFLWTQVFVQTSNVVRVTVDIAIPQGE